MCALDISARTVTPDPSIAEWYGSRAAGIDSGRGDVREGLVELGRRGLPEAGIEESIELVRSVAREDLSTAFSAWAHRMAIDYLAQGGPAARERLASLATADTLGVTALAAGTAHVLGGAPLPVTFRRSGGEVVLDGRIPWASNLIEPFLVVTAAADADDPARTIVVAVPSGTPGLHPAPYPDLLALNATGSTTVALDGVPVPAELVLSDDVTDFVEAVLARFLLLQGAFCSGLADRALAEAEANLGPLGEAIAPDLERTRAEVAEADRISGELAAQAAARRPVPHESLLRLRLRWSGLAAGAVHLELAATGGRGYLSGSPTARRCREAAFLPIQAPTEVLLKWLLSRSA